jgi:hypothetical protein
MEEIKAAAAGLSPDEQVELFKWWIQSESFKKRHLAALKRAIDSGIEDLQQGRYHSYTDANVMQLAADVSQSGKLRLSAGSKSSKR